MKADERRIVAEIAHLYAYQVAPTKIEIRLQQVTDVAMTHAIVVGVVATARDAWRFMDRCERYPNNLHYLMPPLTNK